MGIAKNLMNSGFINGFRATGYGRISDDADEQVSSLLNQIDWFEMWFEE